MKFRFLILSVVLALLSCRENVREDFINSLLDRMTLDEKLGQLTQLPGGRRDTPNSTISEKTKTLIRAGRVGSFFHVSGAQFLKELQQCAVNESRLWDIPIRSFLAATANSGSVDSSGDCACL